jgi:hypothetical protein
MFQIRTNIGIIGQNVGNLGKNKALLLRIGSANSSPSNNGSEPMQNDQAYFFCDIFFENYDTS